ncbi:50S ribosomal protein L3 N(5)-glutamine methyltransferase [Thiorhodococcus minor]|uniref:Ribosomal protein uL3 glutamine methyltransferase n=1 Tax=Thiorhodococcus minor TaxID=57489 RepID=A0A6M0JW92_9GAMM|nr:50S ribosomal protein L3 N(5)-glutamine methyltransferase [Thiorhodococcus minor]NEV61812.1 50S ribosomal protein L3 N(5)-glutamine methyltransferase [Thiorhodococcus minor]
MAKQPDGLVSIKDFVRWGASRFNAEGLFFGHGADNAIDEAAQLVLSALHLQPDLPATFQDCRLTEAERGTVVELIERRLTERLPAAYLTGCAWFAGLEFAVDSHVLVPRSPIAEVIETGFHPWIAPEVIGRVLDLCTGSGCIGIAAAVWLPDAEVDLVDVSPEALSVARQNVERHGVGDRVRVLESDLFDGLHGNHYDVIVSNPPYVSRSELESLPLEYHREPRLGLLGGDDGLDLVVRILGEADRFLTDEGVLIVEVGSSAETLERRLPEVPFTWLELERGGDGVFILTREQLVESQPLVEEVLGL